uniref:uncharacterized protein LOC124035308 n=1 Tax=Oncorhynchus gorbuscha TaxID=8017 RepID=UPI001EAED0F8|nr:uncharacterized protein LOC124035308 [Oncorhynchus gorbuscha]XP_046207430.1 uncharacterized protein LOC124036650 [Oncorhynchus gorbuscha]
MDYIKPAFDILFEQVRKSGSFYMTFFALFLYHIMFDDHLKCSCEDGVKTVVTPQHCIYYMVFPAVILIFLTLWMDREFQRVLRMTCRCRCDLCGRLLGLLIKAVSKGLLWVVCVLFDGDWYMCYQRPTYPCRYNPDKTPFQEDLDKQTDIKVFSMVYGSGLVLFLLVGNSILTAVPWRDICCRSCKGVRPYHRELFEENIWEETEILIEKDLKRTAQESVVLKSRGLLPPLPNAAQGNIQGGSDTTHPEVKDRVITLNNLHFDIISDLDNVIIDHINTMYQNPDPIPNRFANLCSCITSVSSGNIRQPLTTGTELTNIIP